LRRWQYAEAADWVEYCNGTGESRWGEAAREMVFPEPHRVKYGYRHEVTGNGNRL